VKEQVVELRSSTLVETDNLSKLYPVPHDLVVDLALQITRSVLLELRH
jgi:hypothetical protein